MSLIKLFLDQNYTFYGSSSSKPTSKKLKIKPIVVFKRTIADNLSANFRFVTEKGSKNQVVPFGRKFRSPRPVSGWTTDCYYSLVQGPVIKWFGSSDSGFDQKLPLVKLYWIRPNRWWDNRFIAGLSPVYRLVQTS